MLLRRHLPQLLQAEAEFLRLAILRETETLEQHLAEIAARALGEQRVFPAQLHAAGEGVLVVAVLANAHVAGRHARHRAVAVEQHLGGSEPRIDLDPERFRPGREPAADSAERNAVIAALPHPPPPPQIPPPPAPRRP